MAYSAQTDKMRDTAAKGEQVTKDFILGLHVCMYSRDVIIF